MYFTCCCVPLVYTSEIYGLEETEEWSQLDLSSEGGWGKLFHMENNFRKTKGWGIYRENLTHCRMKYKAPFLWAAALQMTKAVLPTLKRPWCYLLTCKTLQTSFPRWCRKPHSNGQLLSEILQVKHSITVSHYRFINLANSWRGRLNLPLRMTGFQNAGKEKTHLNTKKNDLQNNTYHIFIRHVENLTLPDQKFGLDLRKVNNFHLYIK